MKPSAIIRKRIEDRFLQPFENCGSSIPIEAWLWEILTFLDQEAERQKAIEETICTHIDDLEIHIDICDRAFETLESRVDMMQLRRAYKE